MITERNTEEQLGTRSIKIKFSILHLYLLTVTLLTMFLLGGIKSLHINEWSELNNFRRADKY